MNTDKRSVPASAAESKTQRAQNFTRLPNDILDRWLPEVTGAELKVLLYIARRTFGFHEDQAAIGLQRICTGIPGKDRGTGLHLETAHAAVTRLVAKGLVVCNGGSGTRNGVRSTYSINLQGGANLTENPKGDLTENPKGGPFGKSVDVKERKSSSERKVRKKGVQRTVVEAEPTPAPETPKPKPNSLKADDEKPTPPEAKTYASPKDELRAIYREKAGEEISTEVENRFWGDIEIRNVTRLEAIAELRKHTPNHWKNPAGFLTTFARTIRSKMPNVVPVMLVAEPQKAERCPTCKGCGVASWEPNTYCSCRMGHELEAVDKRIEAERTKKALEAAGIPIQRETLRAMPVACRSVQ